MTWRLIGLGLSRHEALEQALSLAAGREGLAVRELAVGEHRALLEAGAQIELFILKAHSGSMRAALLALSSARDVEAVAREE